MPQVSLIQFKCKVFCKVGKVMVSEKQCALVYTIDNFIIVYTETPFAEETGITNQIKMLKCTHVAKLKYKKLGDDTIELLEKKKGLIFSSTSKFRVKLSNPNEL